MELAAEIFFARVEAVAAAGVSQPAIQTVQVPFGIIHVLVRASVDASGIPQVQMEIDTARLNGLGLPAPVRISR